MPGGWGFEKHLECSQGFCNKHRLTNNATMLLLTPWQAYKLINCVLEHCLLLADALPARKQ